MGKHEIIEELGRGAMGQVFRALHIELGREVALKLIDPAAVTNEHALARFHREVKLLSELTHPNIVRFYDSGLHEGRPYFTMEILQGEDLARVMADRGPIPVEEVAAWMATAADALAYLHERGHTHRDVKPSNLMRTAEGRIVVTDFGLVHVDGATVLTRSGELAGTPVYLAPEMLSGADASPAQDVWALALTAHELVLGRAWVKAPGLRELIVKILQEGVPPIETLRDVPAWFAEAQRQALHPDPGARLTAARYRDLLRARAAKRSGARPLPRNRSGDAPVVGAPAAPGGPRTPGSVPPPAVPRFAWPLAAVVLVTFALIGARMGGPRAPALAVVASPAPPDRLRVTLSADPPPGARLSYAGATVDVTARAVELARVPADADVALSLVDAAGAPLAPPVVLRTPPRARPESFHVVASDTAATVGVRFRSELPVVVEVGTWKPRRTIATVESTAGRTPFLKAFGGLAPDTDHFVRVLPQGRFGGVADFRFRTWTRNWGDRYRQMARSLTPENVDETSLLLDETPAPEGALQLCRALEGVALDRLAGIRNVALVARHTLDRCLVDRLLPALDQDVTDRCKALIVAAALECGHPDALTLAEKLLPSLTEQGSREITGTVLSHRGPAAFDPLLASFKAHPDQRGSANALAFADPERAAALFGEWVERPFPAAADVPLRNMLDALARGTIPSAARLMERVLERRPPDWLARSTVDALVALDTPAGAAVLARAHAANPDADYLEWGVVRAGADARGLLRSRIANGPNPEAKRRAAFALGALIYGTGTPDDEDRAVLAAALGTDDARLAGAAAWALGQLGLAHAGLAARATAGPAADPEGFAAWALGRVPDGSAATHAAALVARLAREPGETAAALTRKALVAQAAVALGRAAGDEVHTRTRILAALGAAPASLKQAVEGAPPDRDIGPIALVTDLFPQVPALRLPVQLVAGESVDLRGEGWLALPGGQLRTAAAAQEIPGELGDALTISLYAGQQHQRVKSRFERLALIGDSALIVSCYDSREAPMRSVSAEGAVGWVRVFLVR